MTTLTLDQPLLIGPRLLPAVRLGTAWLSLDPADDWAVHFDWTSEDGEVVEECSRDFTPGLLPADPSAAVREVMRSVLSFFAAFVEVAEHAERTGSDRSLENLGLFPHTMRRWAVDHGETVGEALYDLTHDET